MTNLAADAGPYPVEPCHDQRAIETLRRDRDCWRGIAHAAIEALAESYARTQMQGAQLAAMKDELRRFTQKAVE